MVSLDGRVVLVTGGSSGIGKAAAGSFALAGASDAASFVTGHSMIVDGGMTASTR